MKKYFILVLIVLIVGTLVIGVQAGGKVTKLTGKDAAEMLSAGDVYGGVYDNEWQVPEATGKVNMIQPNGNVDVILGVSVDGLSPNSLYIVYFDTDGGSTGPHPFIQVGNFTTDDYGHGEWNYTAPAGSLAVGDYIWSVAINRTDPAATILVSEDISFEIVSQP